MNSVIMCLSGSPVTWGVSGGVTRWAALEAIVVVGVYRRGVVVGKSVEMDDNGATRELSLDHETYGRRRWWTIREMISELL